MKTKHIIIGLIILMVVLFLMQKKEHIASTTPATPLSNEAIQSIGSIYGSTARVATFNNLKVNGEVDIPNWRGMITMWSGSISALPKGWALCDGSPGTPDLRGRFILGAGTARSVTNTNTTFGEKSYDKEYNFNVGDTGGENVHTLTLEEMPKHTHGIPKGDEGYNGGEGNTVWGDNNNKQTAETGGSKAHNNIPPFYVLAYIIKT